MVFDITHLYPIMSKCSKCTNMNVSNSNNKKTYVCLMK